MYLIFTACTARKDDRHLIADNSLKVAPSDYLDDPVLLSEFLKIRRKIFLDPNAQLGNNETFAFDLYVRKGNAFRAIRDNLDIVKTELILSKKIAWFFLSGGYGIVNAFEPVKKYNATLSRGIASQNKIPYTKSIWTPLLTNVCDSIIDDLKPKWVYVFGSQDYTGFIKKTSYWESACNIRMFESTGSAGPHWLSPLLNKLLKSIFLGEIERFNEKYGRFTKQTS